MKSEKPYDLVFLDLTVPGGMGGLETLEALREIDPDVKAVVASGYINDPAMINYEEVGFVGQLGKPFDLEELSDLVEGVLGKNGPKK